MTKRETTSATSNNHGSRDSAAPQEASELDLNALIVQVDLDALIGSLEEPPDEGHPSPHPPTPDPQETAAPTADRRQAERRQAARLATSQLSESLQVSLPRSARTAVVNVSRTGVLIETTNQLAPGSRTDLFVKIGGTRQALRATVVRSSLHSLAPELLYRSALHFEKLLELPDPSGR